MTKTNYQLLIVEDDEIDIMNIQRAMKKLDLSVPVTTAHDGLEGLEAINSGKLYFPLVILLDINLPRMNGIEFLAKLRALENWKMTPVVVLTSSKDERDMINTYNLNVAGYIIKPIEFNDFAEVIARIERYWTMCEFPKGRTL